ncbi:hypothetical protein Golob_025167 [Gossypium lobatum]|uniref:Uncharacterized protein n=1 Tax=Gossypium lobatum TaxID=34289 RepID=A0A7J8NDI0_9ROSI|nr:hypothetical protein [Gossypium lobatum]
MVSGFGESTSMMPASPSFLGSNNANDAYDFKCNIYFELAQDPIIILCHHLFYWPNLYDGYTIIRIIKNARFAGPSYKRINSFLLIVGGKNQTDPAIAYGTTSGFPHAFNIVNSGHAQGFPQPIARGQ